MSQETHLVNFHFFDFLFTPYKGGESTLDSCRILKECIRRIDKERQDEGKAIVVNRHEGRKKEPPRSLFISSSAYSHVEKKYKCRMALIRDNKIPTLVNNTTYALTPLDQLKNQSIAETTNFYIDVEGEVPIVCCEFNYYGPRASDIEYYFRHISSHQMLRISKSCKAAIHMKMPVNEVLDSIADVLQFKIKARPQRLNYLFQHLGRDSFIGNMKGLANSVEPRSLRVNAFFRKQGSEKNKVKNTKAVALMVRVLEAVKNDQGVAEDFDDFYLEFEKSDGSEDVFNLVKGKEEMQIKCSHKSKGNLNTKELFEKASLKFNNYLESRRK